MGNNTKEGFTSGDENFKMEDRIRGQLPKLNPYENKRHRWNSCAGKDNPRNKKAANITVKPAGGLGQEYELGRRTSSSLLEINPRLRAFFSSRFVIVDAGQSPGASLVMAKAVSGAAFFGAAVAALGPVALMAAPFFLTIMASFFRDCGGLGVAAIRAQQLQVEGTKEEEQDGREREE
jgi:hypothetical protein